MWKCEPLRCVGDAQAGQCLQLRRLVAWAGGTSSHSTAGSGKAPAGAMVSPWPLGLSVSIGAGPAPGAQGGLRGVRGHVGIRGDVSRVCDQRKGPDALALSCGPGWGGVVGGRPPSTLPPAPQSLRPWGPRT